MIRAFFHTLRLARAGYVLIREGVWAQVDIKILPPSTRWLLSFIRLFARTPAFKEARPYPPLARAMERLGPSYVKLGQFLATRPDIVGESVVAQLEHLQDRMTALPQEEAIRAVEHAFQRPLSSLFVYFGPCVAAASMAQVHRARIKDRNGDREVAVKILRPGIEAQFAKDLSDMRFAARWAEFFFSEARRLRCVEVVDTLGKHIRTEIDFRLEAAAASEFGDNVREDPQVCVPKVEWDYVTKDVLTLSWIKGIPLSDISQVKAAGIDLPHLADVVIQSFLRHAMGDGFFHADMHQGNLFVDLEGRLYVVDFGIMGRLGRKEQRFLAEILYGFIQRDYHRVAHVHFEAGYVPAHHRVEDFAQALRAIGEPIHTQTADQISMAHLLTLLFDVTYLFDMQTRPELVLLQKTMVVVEGVARKLNPQVNIWTTAEPVVRRWMEDNLGMKGRVEDVKRGVTQLGHALTLVPDMLERGQRLLADWEKRKTSETAPTSAFFLQILPLWLLVLAAAIFLWRL